MELSEILDRFNEGIVEVDKLTTTINTNPRDRTTYLPGVKTLSERQFVNELVEWWKAKYPNDFKPIGAIDTEVPYPNIARAKCDLIFSTDGSNITTPEWSIEIKHIALVGNNGKNNDYGVAKILSPYLKDRSLIHDIERLKSDGIGKRRAVIGYSFEYSKETCQEAIMHHPKEVVTINNIKGVCRVNDPINLEYPLEPLIKFADEIFENTNLVNRVQIREFSNVWRHPAGGKGKFFAWELK